MKKNQKENKRKKWIDIVVEQLINGDSDLRNLRKQMVADGLSGTSMKVVIEAAQKKIHNEAEDVKDITLDLNFLRLNNIADNATLTTDSISAIDKLNKMLGAYNVNIDLTENVRFILGDVEGLENNFKYENEE